MLSSAIVYDKAKHHLESAERYGLPSIQAYIHTGFFVGWLVDNNLLDEEFSEESREEIDRFSRHEITAPQLYESWDGVLVDDMLSDEGNEFCQYYFDLRSGDYIDDYIACLCSGIESEFHVQDSWENFSCIANVISERYGSWKSEREGETEPNAQQDIESGVNIEHRKHRRGLWSIFFTLWLVAMSSMLLGITQAIDIKLGAAIFFVAAFSALFGCGASFMVTRCGGCGRVLVDLRPNTGNWRRFDCHKCGDCTLVRGQVGVSSD